VGGAGLLALLRESRAGPASRARGMKGDHKCVHQT
jgi:hypothetical protein